MTEFFSNNRKKVKELLTKVNIKKPKNFEYIVLVVIFLMSVSGVIASINKKGDILGGRIFGRQTVNQEERSLGQTGRSSQSQPAEDKGTADETETYQLDNFQEIQYYGATPTPVVQGANTQNIPSVDSPGQVKKASPTPTPTPNPTPSTPGNGGPPPQPGSGNPGGDNGGNDDGLCNNNGKCQGQETHSSCPADCP